MSLYILPPPSPHSCFTFFSNEVVFISQTILNMCQPGSSQILMNKLMTSSISPPVCNSLDVCYSCVCVFLVCLHACVHSCIPGNVSLLICRLPACVCTAGSLCAYARSHIHIRENKKTKPISLCHSNTSVKLPGLFGPIKDNNT